MIRWAARATLAILVFLPSLLVNVTIHNNEGLLWLHAGHTYPLWSAMLAVLAVPAIIVAGALLIVAAFGAFDR